MTPFDQTIQQLRAEFVSVEAQWVATRQIWRDPVGDRFERECWDLIEKETRVFLQALERLAVDQEQADMHSR